MFTGRLFDYSSVVAYTVLCSLFPFLIFLAVVAGFFGTANTATAIIQFAFVYLPDNVGGNISTGCQGGAHH